LKKKKINKLPVLLKERHSISETPIEEDTEAILWLGLW